MAEPTTIIAAISAAMQAIQTWIKVRDAQRTSQRAETGFKRTARAKLAKTQGGKLEQLLPDNVLRTMEKRIENCWDRYLHIIDPDTDSTPSEIDKATKVLQTCICEELARIHKLNGSIPAGKLKDWWNSYCMDQ